jgi:hypothetical protein
MCSKSVVQQIITVRVQVALSAFQDVLNALQRNRDNPNVGFVQQIHERRDATLHHPSACINSVQWIKADKDPHLIHQVFDLQVIPAGGSV